MRERESPPATREIVGEGERERVAVGEKLQESLVLRRLPTIGRILPLDRVYGYGIVRAMTVGRTRNQPIRLVGSYPAGHPSNLGHSDSNGVTLGQALGPPRLQG